MKHQNGSPTFAVHEYIYSSMHCNAICTIVHLHFAHRISMCNILLHILIYNILRNCTHCIDKVYWLVENILKAWNWWSPSSVATSIDRLCSAPPIKSILCLCWAQVLNPNVIVLDWTYICVSSYQLGYVIQKRIWLASPSQMVQEIAEIEVFALVWLLPCWTSYEIRNYSPH